MVSADCLLQANAQTQQNHFMHEHVETPNIWQTWCDSGTGRSPGIMEHGMSCRKVMQSPSYK